MTRPPTDFALLRAVWKRHRDEYENYVEDARDRETKVFVPIDIPAIANELGVDAHSVFGRLYYHLEPIYGESPDAVTGRPRKSFFTPKLGTTGVKCVNFPLLEAVLAGLWQARNRDRWTLWIAVVSLGIAIGSLVVAIA